MENRTYIAIDLKSFYASVECVARELDPLRTNLVVADASRTEKTICLAVSPSLKSYGIPGRARLFEVVEKVAAANSVRQTRIGALSFRGESFDSQALAQDPRLAISYIVAAPRMALYMECSTKIYQIYLKYLAPEDIHIYSIDEVFMDVTAYLAAYRMSPRELAQAIIREVLETTGITATVGIGSNLYLCKIAMDIVAKHIAPDENGARIAQLDQLHYRQLLWDHRPLTDFWRVGPGYAKTLESHGLYTMGDIARCSLGGENDHFNEGLLYRLFGVNAELLIDHAWGWEPCTIADIKAYRPSTNSISSGQVLSCPYSFEKARLILREMADLLALELVKKRIATDHITLTLGYDRESLAGSRAYAGPVTQDRYGRRIPKHAHGTQRLGSPTSSGKRITQAAMALFDRIANPQLLIRRVNLTACRLVPEPALSAEDCPQLSFFEPPEPPGQENLAQEKERRMQETILALKQKYGKNAVLKGMNFQDGATTISRNGQIGGHKA